MYISLSVFILLKHTFSNPPNIQAFFVFLLQSTFSWKIAYLKPVLTFSDWRRCSQSWADWPGHSGKTTSAFSGKVQKHNNKTKQTNKESNGTKQTIKQSKTIDMDPGKTTNAFLGKVNKHNKKKQWNKTVKQTKATNKQLTWTPRQNYHCFLRQVKLFPWQW